MPSRQRAFAVSVALLMAACTSDQTLSPRAKPTAKINQGVARAVATALGDATVRAELRDALRASPLVEHKVKLQEYLVTAAGRVGLIAVAARGARMRESELRDMIGELPPMQLYMPKREDRLSWKATAEVVVVAALDNDGGMTTAWNSAGVQTSWTPTATAPTLAVRSTWDPQIFVSHRKRLRGAT